MIDIVCRVLKLIRVCMNRKECCEEEKVIRHEEVGIRKVLIRGSTFFSV